MATKSPKPGFFTTEFWVTILTVIGGPTAILTAVSTQVDPQGLTFVVMTALASAAAVVWKYIQSRQAAKTGG